MVGVKNIYILDPGPGARIRERDSFGSGSGSRDRKVGPGVNIPDPGHWGRIWRPYVFVVSA